jgi:hypothetical protein
MGVIMIRFVGLMFAAMVALVLVWTPLVADFVPRDSTAMVSAS